MKFKNQTKQVFKPFTFFALALGIALLSCKGEDGEVGPKGDTGAAGAAGAAGAQGPQGPAGMGFDKAFENGFMKGTITGTRRDGTAINETFEYKLSFYSEGFEKMSDTQHTLALGRYGSVAEDDNNYLEMGLMVTNKDQAGATATVTDFGMEYSKLLADRNLFLVQTQPSFMATDIILPMSRANNVTYKLVDYGTSPEFVQDERGETTAMFADRDGNHIYFSQSITADGSYFMFNSIVDKAGVTSTTSELWKDVRLYFSGNDYTFATAAGTDLSETVNVPADTQQISNFAYNPSTGLVTFDFTINVSESRAFANSYSGIGDNSGNTTMNPLEIKGNFSGTVYNGIVMRKGFE